MASEVTVTTCRSQQTGSRCGIVLLSSPVPAAWERVSIVPGSGAAGLQAQGVLVEVHAEVPWPGRFLTMAMVMSLVIWCPGCGRLRSAGQRGCC